ncbi:MAG: sensory histidine kinase AtoS [Methanocella sp. PtaU1.Bin125]|nr:MAG: sensory histidine kinase AtoS [Methanocella sp. PtaU1.Bin125]
MKDLSGTGEYLADAITHGPVSFIAWLSDGRLLTASATFHELTGYSPDETSAMRWPGDFASEGLAGCVLRGMKEPGLPGRSRQCEGNIVGKDRSEIPVSVILHRRRPGDTGEVQYYAFITDTTRLNDREERLQLTQYAIDHFMDSSLWLDSEGRIVYANESACQSLGYTREEMLSLGIWDIDSAYRQDIFARSFENIKNARHMELESTGIAKDGRRFPVEVHASYIQYHGTERVVCFVRDITRRKDAEEALAESEEKFRVLSELSPTAIFLYQGTKLIYANQSAVAFTGFSIDEMTSKNFWDMVHPEYQEMVRAYGLARQRGEPVPARYEVKYVTRYGEERWAEFTAGRIEYRGRPGGIVTAIDTTERKHTEIALQEAKSQAELYVDLMGHDINNMNQAAMGFLEMAYEKLKTRGSLDGEDLDLLASAMGSLRSSSGLIDSVRKLQRERKGGMKPYVLDLSPLLADVKEQYTSVPGREIVIDYTASCPCKVLANELLRDVFANIVGNAIKHSRGAIAISISLSVEPRQGVHYCRVDVEDNGPGISDERKKAIFERAGMDRTKLTGKGLGLYLVKTLVEDFHGRVWVEDRVPGDYRKGARFVVLLPAATAGQKNDFVESDDVCSL